MVRVFRLSALSEGNESAILWLEWEMSMSFPQVGAINHPHTARVQTEILKQK